MKPSFTWKVFLLLLLSGVAKHTAAQQVPSCGTPDSAVADYLEKYAKVKDLTRARAASEDKLEYRLALDINYKTYLSYNGDKSLITKAAHEFIEKASAVFEKEVNIKLTITDILIWDKPEPYPLEQDIDYFNNVLMYWSANRFTERDAVVSLSNRYGWFYGGYRMASSNFPVPQDPEVTVDLLCHELGHTLGSPHTHNCSWPGGPIDRCTVLEGVSNECQDGYSQNVNGSIMSYCRSVLSFHPLCQNLMRDYAEGKVTNEFKLNALVTKPAVPQSVSLHDALYSSISNTPTFEWKAPLYADKYRFQIARDVSFSQIVEDTIVRQSLFQSVGQNAGSYFARLSAENMAGTEGWTYPVSFNIPPFSEASTAPLLLNVRLDNLGLITGYFRPYSNIDSYEIEVIDQWNPSTNATHQLAATGSARQAFQVPLNKYLGGRYSIRLRVRQNNTWSQWSFPSFLYYPGNSTLARETNLTGISSSAMLATDANFSYMHSGMKQSIEISTDASFSNIIYKDSAAFNQMNEWRTTRSIFMPELEESTSYHVRTRLNWLQGVYTKWMNYTLNTGYNDQRFSFVTQVSPILGYMTIRRDWAVKNRFYTAGNKLYVYDVSSGYFSTTDLKNWQSVNAATTKGKTPSSMNFFGAAAGGEEYIMDFNNVLWKKSGDTFESYPMPQYFYNDEPAAIVATKNAGLFIRTYSRGVARFQNGSWQFYDQASLNSNKAICVEMNSADQVWAIMDNGGVWSLQNNQWISQPFFPNTEGLKGIAFDNEQTCYAYGDWGVVRLNKTSQRWERIEQLTYYPVQKIIFDKNNQLWAATYKFVGLEAQDYDGYSLIKMKDNKTSVYGDGLNFLKEPFDITFFHDQLLILTSGGEIHTFDENKIQRFEPKASYCTGESLSVTVTSNSTFAKDNQFGFSLINTANGHQISLPVTMQSGNELSTILPDTIKNGSYRLRTHTTNPEIVSNESEAFLVAPPVPAEVSKVETGRFKTTLIAKEGAGLSYQWQVNGADIVNATGKSLVVDKSGEYSLTLTNTAGCKTKSGLIPVTLDQPGEITLLQNTPNPAGASTEIAFYLPQAQDIQLDLYNSTGQKVAQLKKGSFGPGWHFAEINGNGIPSGIYVYQLEAGQFRKSLKMVR
ncbi:zinc-dependent metalloprotease [Dyadobacter bucti]|uniref:zinc-dependent metalloprotease n=1 Tax=Dyadobacter bucti TaxID=2572203 RepID=UPI001109F3F9|nr:zinc-dependent metalloprotease [Dyadobacter bucti]